MTISYFHQKTVQSCKWTDNGICCQTSINLRVIRLKRDNEITIEHFTRSIMMQSGFLCVKIDFSSSMNSYFSKYFFTLSNRMNYRPSTASYFISFAPWINREWLRGINIWRTCWCDDWTKAHEIMWNRIRVKWKSEISCVCQPTTTKEALKFKLRTRWKVNVQLNWVQTFVDATEDFRRAGWETTAAPARRKTKTTSRRNLKSKQSKLIY